LNKIIALLFLLAFFNSCSTATVSNNLSSPKTEKSDETDIVVSENMKTDELEESPWNYATNVK
jgi:hypothetical protein